MELSKEQLQAGRVASMRNAEELVKEAKLLLHSGRMARTIALCQAAGEEMGKFLLLTTQLVDVIKEGVPTIPWDTFWKYFKDHKTKTKFITFAEDVFLGVEMPPNYHPQLKQGVAELEKLRQWMMYVDWVEGVLYVPNDLVTMKMATDALNWAQGRLRLLTELSNPARGIDHLTPEALRASEARLRVLVDTSADPPEAGQDSTAS